MFANYRRSVLALLLVPVLAAPLSGKPVELKDLTQDLIRARVKAYLAHPSNAQRLAPFRGQVMLRDDQVFYTAVNGVPQRLEWRYATAPYYDRSKDGTTQQQLRDLLQDVLVRFDGGLLSAAHAKAVLDKATFVAVVGAPGVMPPPRGVAPLPPQPGAPGIAARAPVAAPRAQVLFTPYRFIVYPWVATAPRCYHWWQYPWFAAPWYAAPWTSYWQLPAYHPTPWGFWYLPPAYNYWGYWNVGTFYPAHVPYHRPVSSRPASPITPQRNVESLYVEANEAYWNGDANEALRLLNAAIQKDAQDARVWYFKSLAERQLGEEAAAQDSARRAAAVEMLSGGARAQIAHELERVQGDARRFLRSAGNGMTVAQAREITAAPVKVATAK